MTIALRMLLAVLTTLAGCNEAVPNSHRPASAAIAEAQRFRSNAEDCRRREWEDRSCLAAIELFERIGSTPTHFATQSEWQQFSDAYQAGTSIMLTSVLKEACDPATEQAATARMRSMCSVRDPMKIQHVQDEMRTFQKPGNSN